jgi:hypothetical protein
MEPASLQTHSPEVGDDIAAPTFAFDALKSADSLRREMRALAHNPARPAQRFRREKSSSQRRPKMGQGPPLQPCRRRATDTARVSFPAAKSSA